MPNIYGDDFEGQAGRGQTPPPGFGGRFRTLAAPAGAERLGMTLWEVPPGTTSYPYHYHLGDEELVVVLSGQGTVRTPDGVRPLVAGEVISFLPGAQGAHQFTCTGEEPVRFLAISTRDVVDICGYPDSGKVAAREQRPGGYWGVHRVEDTVGYWDGEAAKPDAD